MFEWIKFIGEFFVGLIEGIGQLFTLFADGMGTIYASVYLAPSFLGPIIILTISVAVVMWVVNIF